MSESHAQSRLIPGLTLRYVLVLVALALLVTANYLLLQQQIELGGADSAIINASGRQRMLSQRTALLARQFVGSESPEEAEGFAAELRQLLAILKVTHQRLIDQINTATREKALDQQLHALYFEGDDALDRQFQAYTDQLAQLLEIPVTERPARQALAGRISDTAVAGNLLTQLDLAVHLLQQRSEEYHNQINVRQRWIWLASLAALLYSAFGVFRPMALKIRDEFRSLEEIRQTLALRVRERTLEVQRLAQAVEASAEAILITDTHGVIQYVNRACKQLNGYEGDELLGRHASVFRGDTGEVGNYAELWQTIRDGSVWSGNVINARKDRSRYHAHLTIAPIRGDDDRIDGYVGIQSDITAIKEAEQRLRHANQELDRLATEDALTGIANRRVFDQTLDEEWGRARRTGTPLALIMIDIDFFKAYNDRFGHQQGDVCLQQVAQALASALSRPGDRVARYGGEEFAVLLPDTTVNGALDVAENIRRRIRALALPAANTTVSPHVSVSMGVASLVPGRKQPAEELVQTADRALYQAKASGRNRALPA